MLSQDSELVVRPHELLPRSSLLNHWIHKTRSNKRHIIWLLDVKLSCKLIKSVSLLLTQTRVSVENSYGSRFLQQVDSKDPGAYATSFTVKSPFFINIFCHLVLSERFKCLGRNIWSVLSVCPDQLSCCLTSCDCR